MFCILICPISNHLICNPSHFFMNFHFSRIFYELKIKLFAHRFIGSVIVRNVIRLQFSSHQVIYYNSLLKLKNIPRWTWTPSSRWFDHKCTFFYPVKPIVQNELPTVKHSNSMCLEYFSNYYNRFGTEYYCPALFLEQMEPRKWTRTSHSIQIFLLEAFPHVSEKREL